jgi:hypothetical protein
VSRSIIQQIWFLHAETSGKDVSHAASMSNQSGALRFGILSSESSGRVLFPLLCHGCSRLCMIMRIDMMTFTENLYKRGDEVCRGFDSDGLVLVLVLASLGRRWGLGLMFMIS